MKKYLYLSLTIAVLFFGNWLWVGKSILQSIISTALFFIIYFIVTRFFPSEQH